MDTEKHITDEIVESLRQVPSNFPHGAPNPKWTEAVKLAVAKVGSERGYAVCGLKEFYGNPGWLFDLCWYQDSESGTLGSVPLVMESEWNPHVSAIKYDFEKLLVAKSRFKVMVYQACGAAVDERFSYLERTISSFMSVACGETYILACFDEVDWEFKIKVVEW